MIPFLPFPVLLTPRLVLREILPSDAEIMHRTLTDPEVTRYMGKAPAASIAETEQRIERIATDIREHTAIRWGIAVRGGGELAGTAGFWRWNKRHDLAEIGYELAPAAWGRGYMTEALRAILRFGFDAMDLHRVEANTDPENAASRRVLERLGFVQEGLLREQWRYEGRYTDTATFGLLLRDFEAKAARVD